MSLNEVLESFGTQVSQFATSGVVHRTEGTAIASVEGDESVDAAAGDAYLAEVLKLHTTAQQKLGIESTTEDVVLQTSRGILVARPLADSDYLWTVITGPGANVALTRALMRKFHDQVNQALPGSATE